MPHPAKFNNIRKRRDKTFEATLEVIREGIDKYEQSNLQENGYLRSYQEQLKDGWDRFKLTQTELDEFNEDDIAQETQALRNYLFLDAQIKKLMDENRSLNHSITPKRESDTGSEVMSIKLPEMHLSMFDGTIEEWKSFYDTFISTIDRNEKLTSVQKFHYLRSSVTGKAARCIQTLDITESNYSIAINVLREKFDCHRQVCMRHWHLIRDYPKITKETPDAIDDFLETIQINLKALEKLGEPVMSNVILIDLFISKLPSSTIRKWQHTLPDKKMPSYTHLINFLTTRANGDRINATPKETKESSYQRSRHRHNLSRGQTFTTTNKMRLCPICQSHHDIRNCEAFKAKSTRKRFEFVKRASLCTNCLGKGHSTIQCSARSCRICRQRHDV
jgi:Arc/MetJ-type ribon-helix-helix transcriptional regulator